MFSVDPTQPPREEVHTSQSPLSTVPTPGHPGTITPSSQAARWSRIIDMWVKASQEGLEIITMGDTNLNSLRWDIPEASMNSYDRTNNQ